MGVIVQIALRQASWRGIFLRGDADRSFGPLFNPHGVDIMADLVEIAFPSEEKAEQVRQKLLDSSTCRRIT